MRSVRDDAISYTLASYLSTHTFPNLYRVRVALLGVGIAEAIAAIVELAVVAARVGVARVAVVTLLAARLAADRPSRTVAVRGRPAGGRAAITRAGVPIGRTARCPCDVRCRTPVIVQLASQPSPLSRLPSSHSSGGVITPLPHSVQALVQPSDGFVLPSSHSSRHPARGCRSRFSSTTPSDPQWPPQPPSPEAVTSFQKLSAGPATGPRG